MGTTALLLDKIKENILNPIVTVLFAVALLVFLYGVLELVRNANDPAKRRQGGMHILWGVIGMTIMVSAFGIVNLICGTIHC